MYRHPPTESTIFEVSPEELPSSHPLYYTRQKNYFLQQLSDKIATENRLPAMDLKRSLRADYYMSQYRALSELKQRQAQRRKSYLKSQDFQSIFSQEHEKQHLQKQQEKEERRMQAYLYENYVESESNKYEEPQHDYEVDEHNPAQLNVRGVPQGFTVLRDYREDENRLKELYLLDLEIGHLRKEEEIERKVKDKHEECQNMSLLQRLSNNIISSYMVYFDEIYALLIDEILEEEVYYFNSLEAGYRVSQQQKRGKQGGEVPKKNQSYESSQNVKTMRMMELVKELEELCDD